MKNTKQLMHLIKAGFHLRWSHNQKYRAYDLVKIVFQFRLRLRRLCSAYDLVQNKIVGVGSRSRRTKPITKHVNVHCDWLILPILLLTPTIWFSPDHKWNVSDGVVREVGRNGIVLILLTPIPLRL